MAQQQQNGRERKRFGVAIIVACVVVAVAILALVRGCGDNDNNGSAPAAPSSSAVTAPAASLSPVASTLPDTSAPAAVAAAIYDCNGQSAAKPASLVLFCADGNAHLDSLSWTGWGLPTATAEGELWENSCSPDCANGTFTPYPVTVTATGLSGGGYTAMRLSAPAAPTPTENYALTKNGPRWLNNG